MIIAKKILLELEPEDLNVIFRLAYSYLLGRDTDKGAIYGYCRNYDIYDLETLVSKIKKLSPFHYLNEAAYMYYAFKTPTLVTDREHSYLQDVIHENLPLIFPPKKEVKQ